MNALTLIDVFTEASSDEKFGVTFWNGQLQGEFYSYQLLQHDIFKVASTLIQRGIKKGDRVAIMLPTDPDFHRVFFGTIYAGGIPCALYPPVRLGKIEEWQEKTVKQLEVLEASFFIVSPRLKGIVGTPLKNIKVTPPQCLIPQQLLEEGSVYPLDSQSSEIKKVQANLTGEDSAFIQFSSGTTGNPKAVVITHQNLLHNAQSIISLLPKEICRRGCVSWLPLYHDMGLVGCMISSLVMKTPLHLIPPELFMAKPKLWLDVLTLTKSGSTVAPNFAYGLCASKAKANPEAWTGLDLSLVEVALCGAETVYPPTLDEFAQIFSSSGFNKKALTPVYGMAEVTLAATFSPVDEVPRWTAFDRQRLEQNGVAIETEQGEEGSIQLASVGGPLPGIIVEIRSDEGDLLADGVLGTIWLRGPSVMKEYFNHQQTTADALQKGWLKTGDKGFLHKNNLYIFGRTKDILIIRGRNLDPSFIESSLFHIPGIRKGCVVAVADYDESEGTEKVVILAESHPPLSQPRALREAIATEILSSTQVKVQTTDIHFLAPGTLPRTSSGKIKRVEAKNLWKQGNLKAPKKWVRGAFFKETLKGYINHWGRGL